MKICKEKIEFIMAKHSISPAILSERSGISRQSISTIKNRGTCTPITAAKLAFGLGVEVEEIIKKEEP